MDLVHLGGQGGIRFLLDGDGDDPPPAPAAGGGDEEREAAVAGDEPQRPPVHRGGSGAHTSSAEWRRPRLRTTPLRAERMKSTSRRTSGIIGSASSRPRASLVLSRLCR